MLFDLRSRGRRRTVQAVYLGLALLMGGGLVLFGVGAGNGLGGLLNAFTGNGSSPARRPVVSQQEKAALKADQARPDQFRRPGPTSSRPAGPPPARAPTSTPPPASSPRPASNELSRRPRTGSTTCAHQEPGSQPRDPRRPRLRRTCGNYSGEASAWDIETPRRPQRGQGLRVPCRLRLRRQADPQGRPGLRQGPQPGAQGPAGPAQEPASVRPRRQPSVAPAMLTRPAGTPRG